MGKQEAKWERGEEDREGEGRKAMGASGLSQRAESADNLRNGIWCDDLAGCKTPGSANPRKKVRGH